MADGGRAGVRVGGRAGSPVVGRDVGTAERSPRVVVVNFAFDPNIADPNGTLDAFAALRQWAAGLRAAGLEVGVVQRHSHDALVLRDGVEYCFVAAGRRGRPRSWQPALRVTRTVVDLDPDLVHVNGLVFPLQTRLLRRRLRPRAAIVVQHHAESPRRGLRGRLQRWGLAEVDGFLFTSAAQAAPWLARGVVHSEDQVFEVMEGATDLLAEPVAMAQDRSRLTGSPALLWVGRLQAVK
ncbi:MAG TPA: glycosyltransferase, partial [Trueperaceae bacterium]|nr:glycosyltransferase [Trueperaceae bacterium]